MLEGLTPPNKHNICKVQAVAQALDPKDREILKEAVMNPDWTISGLTRELKNRGIGLSEKPITAHRKGQCPCSKA